VTKEARLKKGEIQSALRRLVHDHLLRLDPAAAADKSAEPSVDWMEAAGFKRAQPSPPRVSSPPMNGFAADRLGGPAEEAAEVLVVACGKELRKAYRLYESHGEGQRAAALAGGKQGMLLTAWLQFCGDFNVLSAVGSKQLPNSAKAVLSKQAAAAVFRKACTAWPCGSTSSTRRPAAGPVGPPQGLGCDGFRLALGALAIELARLQRSEHGGAETAAHALLARLEASDGVAALQRRTGLTLSSLSFRAPRAEPEPEPDGYSFMLYGH
jgi:hypothetical protein